MSWSGLRVIPNFIGVTDPYEPPASPEVKYDSSKVSVDDAATRVMEALVREGVLKPDDIGLSRVPPRPEDQKDKKNKNIGFNVLTEEYEDVV